MENNSKVEVVNLAGIILPISLIKKIPLELIKKYEFIPIGRKGDILTCAFGELPQQKVINDIEAITGHKIKIVLAAEREIGSRIKELCEDEKKCLDVSLRLRQLEIELFWKRSLFFWGFIASSFAAFIIVAKETNLRRDYSILIASFGFICSLCWSLINRGSKRWQENWEQNAKLYGKNIVGNLLNIPRPIQKKGWWLGARAFSPSKLAIALSDYTIFLWVIILLNEVIQRQKDYRGISIINWIVVIITIALIPLIIWLTKPSEQSL